FASYRLLKADKKETVRSGKEGGRPARTEGGTRRRDGQSRAQQCAPRVLGSCVTSHESLPVE
ncbi:hypothetical protein ABZ070_23320, partial [Streptomyces sp. NPDC006283]|uniref:hypothetical protein n=1 Tax=Streptomyces sp. NPDC006283 TaxID=3156741 RepID=UPI0033B6F477